MNLSAPRRFLTPLALATAALLTAGPSLADSKKLCPTCGVVQAVHSEKRDGEGGAVGIVGGAVVGGLLGNQIGGGTGKTLATVGGAVGGAYVGNEVQKKVTKKTVWVTDVKMKDGSLRRFETASQPAWGKGGVVRVDERGQLIPLK